MQPGRFLLHLLLLLPAAARAEPCTYETWEWNAVLGRAEHRRLVETTREKLTAAEKGTVPGCTVCREDQEELKLPGHAPLRVCRVLKPRVEEALREAVKAGFPLRELVGYRVGKSRGDLDASGLRTRFSNHSYGTAIDVNSGANGLYENCESFGPLCKLRRGGAWRPGAPGTIEKGGPLHSALTKAGFRWGGELRGRQKDFMHFSLSGD